MTVNTHAFTGTPPASAAREIPAIRFYSAYSEAFANHFDTTPSDKFYAASCKMHLTDGSLRTDGAEMWKFFGSLYSAFPKVTRDLLSFIVVSDDDAGTHQIHTQFVTSLHLDASGQRKIDVPQAFVYTLGKADEGKGTEGLQFVELRNYYDRSLIDKVKAML